MARLGRCLLWLGLLDAALADGDPCECLQWRDVYRHGQALCGEYAEISNIIRPMRWNLSLDDLASIPDFHATAAYYKEKCSDFVTQLDDNLCLNLDGHSFSGWMPEATDFEKSTWCYVSSACRELQGGRQIPSKRWSTGVELRRNISVKHCRRGKDRLLRDARPEELRDMVSRLRTRDPARTKALSLGLVVLEAYRAQYPSKVWRDIEPLLARGALGELPTAVQRSLEEREPIVVYIEGQNHESYKLLWGEDVYHFDDERRRSGGLFGLAADEEHVCPETVHCMRKSARSEL